MKELLKHLGLSRYAAVFVSASESGDEAIFEWTECSGMKAGTAQSVKLSETNRTEIMARVEGELAGLPLVVWDTAEFQNSDVIYSVDEWLEDHEVWNVSGLVKALIPTLPDFNFLSMQNLFSLSKEEDSNDTQKLSRMFVRLLERVARMDLKDLSVVIKLSETTHSPVRKLFKSVAGHMKEGPKIYFLYPPLALPPLPPNVIGHGTGPVGSDAIESVRSGLVDDVFRRGGFLNAQFEHYEERAEQIELAGAITSAFNERQFILAEAGTGTGKSLAYLVPALYWTSQNHAFGESVVISTHTKNLQDQLFFKDIPLLEKILPVSFRAVLLKGRGNYLCIKKWKNILMDPSAHLTPAEREKVLPIYFWAKQTETGDIGECNGFALDQNVSLWNKLASESAYCQSQKCNSSDECFVKKIRDEARKAHAVIVNHSLLFSDLISENAVLGEYHNLILDEAHHVEKTAQNYLGVEFSMWSAKSFVAGLYESDQFETGALIQLKQKLAAADLPQLEKAHAEKNLLSATEGCTQFWNAAQNFFRMLTAELIKEKDFEMSEKASSGSRSSKSNAHQSKVRFQAGTSPMRLAETEMNLFFEAEQALRSILLELVEAMKNWKSDVFENSDDMRQSLLARIEDLHRMAETVQFLLEADNSDYVYWYELPAKERSYDTRFYAVPLNIAEILRTRLFERLNTCVFSSATLSVAGNFNYYKSRVGLDPYDREKLTQFSVGSPFDFRNQCRIFVASFLPDPSHPDFTRACAALIRNVISQYRKGTLVLFTSFGMMNACYREVKNSCGDVQVLLQGQDGSRTSLTQKFLQDKHSVLFGTDSFWGGVDIPGESLELVIITKLPFEVPTDPLVAAKVERIDAMGGKSFFDYSVPEAVIKFRQGFGRLIRSKSDRGIALILDNRVVTKSYGKSFLDSLPARSQDVQSEHELMEGMSGFFSLK